MKNLPRLATACCIAVSALALGGCSSIQSMMPSFLGGSSSKEIKPAELTTNPGTYGVGSAWQARVGAVDFPMTVQVVGNTAFLASGDGTVAAIDAQSGRDLWRASVGPIAAGVGSDGTTTAVVTTSNDLVALVQGRESWRQRLPSGAYTAPFVAGERVFVLTGDRAVIAFDGKTGRRLWGVTRPGEALVLRNSGVMLAVGDTLVVGLSGRLVGLNPLTGATRWEAPIASPRGINDVERLVDLVGRVSRVGNNVCARAFQSSVGCVDASRGQLLWTKQANGSEGISGDETQIYGTEFDGRTIAWKRENGDRAWSTDLLSHRSLSAPLSLGRSVVMGDYQGYVHFLSREDGKLMNRVATDGSPIQVPPVVAGNTLVVVTRTGGVYGFVPQ